MNITPEILHIALLTLKAMSLFYAIFWTTINIARGMHGQRIPMANFFLMSLSIAVFVFIQFELWK